MQTDLHPGPVLSAPATRRPNRRRNFYLGLLLGIALVVGFQTCQQEALNSTSGMPAPEAAFVTAADAARSAWLTAPNQLAKSNLRAARAAALCRALPGLTATDWRGRITGIDPDSFPDYRGKQTVRIVIALTAYLSISTPSAPLLNNPATMVEAGSPLYSLAAALPLGTPVIFSGTFFGSAADCMTETSLTLNASMTDPVFKIDLTRLESR